MSNSGSRSRTNSKTGSQLEFASTAKFSKKALSKRGFSTADIAAENTVEKGGVDKDSKTVPSDPHISGDEEGTKVLQAVNNAIVTDTSDSDTDLEQDGERRRFKRKKRRNISGKSNLVNDNAIDYLKEIEKYKISLTEMSKQLDSSVKTFSTRESNLKRQRDDALDEVNQLRNKVMRVMIEFNVTECN